MIAKPPITLSDLDESWVPATREAMRVREGVPVRAGHGNTIEAYSINRDRWMPIMLTGGGTRFASAEERDAVLLHLNSK